MGDPYTDALYAGLPYVGEPLYWVTPIQEDRCEGQILYRGPPRQATSIWKYFYIGDPIQVYPHIGVSHI